MKCTYGPLISDARKKIGGVVATRVHSGSMLRKKVAPSQPRTPRQHAVRGGLTQFAKDWSAKLTEAQRLAWAALASGISRSDSLGNKHKMTGLTLFVALNQNLLLIGQGENLDPPPDLQPVQLTELDAADCFVETLATTGVTFLTGTNTYAYTLDTGTAPVDGDRVNISGYTDAGNNGDFIVTDTGSGTFSVAAPDGVTTATPGVAAILHFAVNFTPTPLPAVLGDYDLVVSATKPVSAGRASSFGSPAYLMNTSDAPTSPVNISDAYASKYGYPPAGKKVKLVAFCVRQQDGVASAKWSCIAQF